MKLYNWRSQRDQHLLLEEKFLTRASFANRKCSIPHERIFKQPMLQHDRGKRMTFDSPMQYTTLNENTVPPLYLVLQESDLTNQDPNLGHHREKFFDHRKTLINFELTET